MALHHEYPIGCDSPEDRRKFRAAARKELQSKGEYEVTPRDPDKPKAERVRKSAGSIFARRLMEDGKGNDNPAIMAQKLTELGLYEHSLDDLEVPYVFSIEGSPSAEQLIRKFNARWPNPPEWFTIMFGGHSIGLGPVK